MDATPDGLAGALREVLDQVSQEEDDQDGTTFRTLITYRMGQLEKRLDILQGQQWALMILVLGAVVAQFVAPFLHRA